MSQASHTILTNLFKRLQELKTELGSDLTLRSERIYGLEWWRNLRFEWLYFNREEDLNESPFANEIAQNILNPGEEYQQSYKAQLRRLLNEQVYPIQTIVAKELEKVGNEVSEPVGKPHLFSLTDEKNSYWMIREKINRLRTLRWVRSKSYQTWEKKRVELGKYNELLLYLNHDLQTISKTVTTALGDYVQLQRVTEQTPDNSAKQKETTYNSFIDLLFNPDDVGICINALHRIEPPLINSTGRWIDSKRGKKSMLVAWWDAAKQNGYVRSPANDRDLARLLNEYLPGLDLEMNDAGIFRQNTTTRTKYHPDFLALMPRKKLT